MSYQYQSQPMTFDIMSNPGQMQFIKEQYQKRFIQLLRNIVPIYSLDNPVLLEKLDNIIIQDNDVYLGKIHLKTVKEPWICQYVISLDDWNEIGRYLNRYGFYGRSTALPADLIYQV